MKTAVEVGNDMIGAKLRPLTRDECKNFVLMATMREDPELPPDVPLPFGMQILQKRLAHHGVRAENRVMMLVTFLCDRPGTIVLYAAAIKAIAAKKTEPGPVTFNEFVEAFAIGFPTDEELNRIWDSQKVQHGDPGSDGVQRSDNWLDRDEAWA